MIDVHCHLNFHSFKTDYDTVIKSAFEAGVTKIINVGTKIDSSQKAVELANKYENLYAIVGIHPHHADKIPNKIVILGSEAMYRLSPGEATPESKTVMRDSGQDRMTKNSWIEQLKVIAKDPKVVAIGECGLDYYRYKSNAIVDPKLQKEVFIKQIELAHKLKLPLQIHNRHAGKDIFDILINHKSLILNPPGMFHCFAGSMDILKSALQMGFYVGFDGNITYNGLVPGEDTDLKTLVKYTPMDRILVETDSPFLTPEPMRGSRNVPSYAIINAQFIAKIKGVAFDTIEAKTTANAIKLFKL